MTDLKPEDLDALRKRLAFRVQYPRRKFELPDNERDLATLDALLADRARMEKAAQAVCAEFAQGHPLIVALKATLGASQ